jgi:putative ABC transport system ATP-binding protein
MSAAIIQTQNLYRTFHVGATSLNALADVNLSITENSFCLIMGPSGSGKSTLLHLIGGLDRPTSGRISVGGKYIDKLDENALAHFRRQTVGFVFQSFNLIPGMSALENIEFPMRFNGTHMRKRRSVAQSLIKQVELENWSAHRPNELSGGQQQRIALARALVNDPQILLADEPTGNLDTTSGDKIMQLFAQLHKDGKTVIVVSHDFRLMKFATIVINLLDGRVVSENGNNAQKASNLPINPRERRENSS